MMNLIFFKCVCVKHTYGKGIVIECVSIIECFHVNEFER